MTVYQGGGQLMGLHGVIENREMGDMIGGARELDYICPKGGSSLVNKVM